MFTRYVIMHCRATKQTDQQENIFKRFLFSISALVKVVCYTDVFSVVTQRSFPQTAAENRTTFLSRGQPIRIQLPFSGRRYVCGTVTPPITALPLSVPHV